MTYLLHNSSHFSLSVQSLMFQQFRYRHWDYSPSSLLYYCIMKYTADWMFPDVCTAAEQSMLLTGCLLMSALLQNKVCYWLDVYWCLHCCGTKYVTDWMFTDVCTAAEQSMLLTGCLLMSALLQNKVCYWLDIYWCLHCCRTKYVTDWIFTDVCTAAEQSALLTGYCITRLSVAIGHSFSLCWWCWRWRWCYDDDGDDDDEQSGFVTLFYLTLSATQTVL